MGSSDFVKIYEKGYAVLVTAITETFNILYTENTGRTLDGAMSLDPIGTYLGHKVTFKRRSGYESAYDDLFELLSKPRTEGIPIEIVHNQSTVEYDAYVSTGERAVKRIGKDGKVYWDELSVNFIPMRPWKKAFDVD